MTKKIVSLTAALLLLLSSLLSLPAFAASRAEPETVTYVFGDVEVELVKTESLTEEKMAYLAAYLAGEVDEEATTYGLWCTLFGHDWGEIIEATRRSHRVYDDEPRCVKEEYTIRECNECGAIEDTVLSTQRFHCHAVGE